MSTELECIDDPTYIYDPCSKGCHEIAPGARWTCDSWRGWDCGEMAGHYKLNDKERARLLLSCPDSCIDGACNRAKFRSGFGLAIEVKEHALCGAEAVMGMPANLQGCADLCASVDYCEFFAYERDDLADHKNLCRIQFASAANCPEGWQSSRRNNFYQLARPPSLPPMPPSAPPPPWLTTLEIQYGLAPEVASGHPFVAVALLFLGVLLGVALAVAFCCLLKCWYDRSELKKRRARKAAAQVTEDEATTAGGL